MRMDSPPGNALRHHDPVDRDYHSLPPTHLHPLPCLARFAGPSAGQQHDSLGIAIALWVVGNCCQPAASLMHLLLFLALVLHDKETQRLAGHFARRTSVPLAWPPAPTPYVLVEIARIASAEESRRFEHLEWPI